MKNKPNKVQVIFDPETVRKNTRAFICPKCKFISFHLGICPNDELRLTPTIANRGQFAGLVGISANGYSRLASEPSQERNETMAGIISATGCKLEDLFRVVEVKEN